MWGLNDIFKNELFCCFAVELMEFSLGLIEKLKFSVYGEGVVKLNSILFPFLKLN